MIRYLQLIFLAYAMSIATSQAQERNFEVPATNSHARIQQSIAATDIEVIYNRPSVKGRAIFGSLVSYDEVWRTGSDASTKISFSTTVSIGDQDLAAGQYELFSIPGKKDWTIILQKNRSQWGSYRYDQQYDVLRTTVPVEKLKHTVETFNIGFDRITSSTALLSLSWEKVSVSIPISIDLRETVLPKLEASLKIDGSKPYFRAAMFYFENDLGIVRAAELMELALEKNPGHIGMLYRYALILEKKGDIKVAIKASERSLEGAQEASGELKSEYIKLNTALLQRLKK